MNVNNMLTTRASDTPYNNSTFTQKIGQLWNDLTGVTASQKWQASREDTAYQRTIEDMKKAGLNPYIMYGGSGASGRSSASPGSAGAGVYNALGATIANLAHSAVALHNGTKDRQNKEKAFNLAHGIIQAGAKHGKSYYMNKKIFDNIDDMEI